MKPFYSVVLERLRSLHEGMVQSMEGLPQDALDWKPGAEMNSLAVIATHTAGAESFLVRQLVALEVVNRSRDSEFVIQGVSSAQLAQLLCASEHEVARVLEGLEVDDLDRERVLPSGEKVTVAWALLHTLDHTGEHLGHMGITRQLWEQR